MAKSYRIILHSIGPNKALLIENIRSYSGIDTARIDSILDNLPATIIVTNSKLKASIIKEAIQSLGASVSIELVNEYATSSSSHAYDEYGNHDSGNFASYNDYEFEEYDNSYGFEVERSPHNVWKHEINTRDDFGYNPMQGASGCLLIVFAGIALVASGLFVIFQ